MKVLVTGNAGFIGFHVCKKLIERGDVVVGLDNLNNYYDIELKKSRLKILKKTAKESKARYSFFKLDISNRKEVKKIFKKFKFDRVIHLAAQVGVRYSLRNPEVYVDSNLLGFSNIIDASYRSRVPHFVYASSSSVYGNNSKIQFKETDNTDCPKQIYAATKKANEVMAYSYSSLCKLKTTGLRYFTVYGPWGRPDMALFKFTKNILKNKKINLYNKGKHLRDFTFIEDIANLTIITSDNLDKFNNNKRIPFQIFNVGNSVPLKLERLVKIIEKILKIKSRKKFISLQKGDMVNTFSNSSKIFKKFNYKIQSNHFKNIGKFINWYRSYYNI